MEKRQAVEFLEYLRQDRNLEKTIYGDALNMAIEALKAQLFKENTTKDAISRQAAIDAINSWRGRFSEEYNEAIDDCENSIKELPPAQPERKKGEWLPDNNNAYEMRFICSCCEESEVVPTIGFTKYKPLWDFCPNCGADMRGEKDGRFNIKAGGD